MANLQTEKEIILYSTDVWLMGCRGTLLDMSRAGWDVAIERRYESNQMAVVLSHRKSGSYCVGQMVDGHLLREIVRSFNQGHQLTNATGWPAPPRMSIHIDQFVADAVINIQAPMGGWKDFTEITAPQQDQVKLSELSLFGEAEEEAPTIIKPQSVPELMAQILKMQEPNQADIRKKILKERRQVKHQAKIITLTG